MSRTFWVNMILEVVDESGLFKWAISEEDEGAITVHYSDWDGDARKWKKPSGELTVYGTAKAREVAKRMLQLCDHMDAHDREESTDG